MVDHTNDTIISPPYKDFGMFVDVIIRDNAGARVMRKCHLQQEQHLDSGFLEKCLKTSEGFRTTCIALGIPEVDKGLFVNKIRRET